MARLSAGHSHGGTWGCNGGCFWYAFPNEMDPQKAPYPNVSGTVRECKATKGPTTFYC